MSFHGNTCVAEFGERPEVRRERSNNTPIGRLKRRGVDWWENHTFGPDFDDADDD